MWDVFVCSLYSAPVIAVMYEASYYTGPRYNGTYRGLFFSCKILISEDSKGYIE